MSDEEVSREDYTWEMATKDLALSTHLTFSEAWDLTYILKENKHLHPYDVFTPLVKMCGFLLPGLGRQSASIFGNYLYKLIELGCEEDDVNASPGPYDTPQRSTD